MLSHANLLATNLNSCFNTQLASKCAHFNYFIKKKKLINRDVKQNVSMFILLNNVSIISTVQYQIPQTDVISLLKSKPIK